MPDNEIAEADNPPQKCAKCNGSGQIVKEWDENENDFEEYLNDIFGDVKVCGLEYPAGRVLRRIDEIAFRTAMNDTEIEEDCPDCDGTGEIEDRD